MMPEVCHFSYIEKHMMLFDIQGENKKLSYNIQDIDNFRWLTMR